MYRYIDALLEQQNSCVYNCDDHSFIQNSSYGNSKNETDVIGLRWNSYIDHVTFKAQRMLNLLNRTCRDLSK